ncbi:MAG: hypothetical protein HRU81_01975 [Gammaproteobacteria bacterium]|nr:MAG: hypothetical protein HRU81_01975 [Gammaproteobacteria bacterium]
MTPIEQVRPPTAGNWTRRPEGRNKRGGQSQNQSKTQGNDQGDSARRQPDRSRPGRSPEQDRGGAAEGGHEHIVDELA